MGSEIPEIYRKKRRILEATGGFEPPNRGFADLRLNHLATSPRLLEGRALSTGVPCFGAEGGI